MKLKIIGAVAALAMAMPLATTTPSAAQGFHRGGGGGGGPAIGGGGPRGGGPHFGGGGRPGGGVHIGGGGRPGGGPGWHGGGPRPGGGWHGGGRPGGWHGGPVYRRGGGGFYPGLAAGAIIGGALATAPFAYGYSEPYVYDDDFVDAPAVVGDADAIAYCQQRFRSYDVRTGTYLGYDGLRHPCP